MKTQWRSKKQGNKVIHYPITCSYPRPRRKINFDLLSNYYNAETPQERLRFKRAAQYASLQARSRGDLSTAEYYQKLVEQMTPPKEEPRPGLFANDFLTAERKIGVHDTTLWTTPNLPKTAKIQLIKSFNRLPPSAQQRIRHIELIGNPGPQEKIDGKEYSVEAHWDSREKTVRVFNVSSGRDSLMEQAERKLAHEAGHALYEGIIDHSEQEYSKVSDIDALKISQRIHFLRTKHFNDLQDRYNAQDAPLYARYRQLVDERLKASYQWDTERMKQIDKEIQKVNRKRARIDRLYQEEKERISKTYDTFKILDRLYKHKRPVTTLLNDFRSATTEEGGLTPYSQIYVKGNLPTRFSENFAEAMAIWYSGAYTDNEARKIAQSHPRTYQAFQRLIHLRAEGHSVPITEKPV